MPDLLNVLNPALTKAAEHLREQDSEHKRLRKATREMEGYFVGMLLKKMHGAAAKGGLFDQKSESATYREMFDEAIAAEIGRQGRFGIADMLYKELVIRLEGPKR